jgi:hypothetical protein
MSTPAELKFRLEKKLADLAKGGGPAPVITGHGNHSKAIERQGALNELTRKSVSG